MVKVTTAAATTTTTTAITQWGVDERRFFNYSKAIHVF
jgi:hypothetical protein